jgi:carboxymethylenebutenolidase
MSPEARTVDVETPDGPMPLYEVIPEAPKGAVVVIQEIFGVNHHIQDVTRRYADAGYHAVAPHLFHRTGSPELGYEDFSAAMPHMQPLTDEKVLVDVDAAIGHLARAGWGSPQIGVVGFCFGGRVSFLAAVSRPLGAAVGFYGGGIVTSRFPQFPSLVERAGDLKAPWLGLFGDQDQSIPVEDVERLRNELGGSGTPVAHDIIRYAEAGHGFHCDAREGHYHEASARDAWQKSLEWLGHHLQ